MNTSSPFAFALALALFGASYDAATPAFSTAGSFCYSGIPVVCHLPDPSRSDSANHTVPVWSVAASGVATNPLYATVTNFVTGDEYQVEQPAPVYPGWIFADLPAYRDQDVSLPVLPNLPKIDSA